MVVSGASSSVRGHGTDRFYNPPAIRRQLQLQQQQQQGNHQRSPQKASRAKPRPPRSTSPANSPAIDVARAESDCSSSKSATNSNSSSSPPPIPAGNLDRFLESTTPVVPTQCHPKTSVRGWRSSDCLESFPYFELRDLWESFGEWSAYGAGVPLILSGNDFVVQYYVPYLSGIQLYVDSSRLTLRSRQPGEENGIQTYQDMSSETSSSGDSHAGQEGSSGHVQANRPTFEYLARDSPYGREPLANKISALADKFPGLMTYRSCDLLPSSWMCVAWYPIYKIPTGQTLKDLDACFLTYHSLSTPTNNVRNGHTLSNGGSSGIRGVDSSSKMPGKVSVTIFGLASYKLQDSIWTSNGQNEQQLSLLQAAANWLRHLNVDHPDFQFFLSRYNTALR